MKPTKLAASTMWATVSSFSSATAAGDSGVVSAQHHARADRPPAPVAIALELNNGPIQVFCAHSGTVLELVSTAV